jgi:hypothetical protein
MLGIAFSNAIDNFSTFSALSATPASYQQRFAPAEIATKARQHGFAAPGILARAYRSWGC